MTLGNRGLALVMFAFLGMSFLPEAAGHGDKVPAEFKKFERRDVRIKVRDFSLTDQDGRTFQFQQLRGKVVLLAFAYTTCPDVCPLITAALRQVQSDLTPAEKNSVYLLTITTDVEVDSPQVLSSYAKRFAVDHSNWAFLTGDHETLSAVWKNLGVKVVRKARGLIDHTPLTAVIDAEGITRSVYLGSAPDAKMILRDVRSLVARR